MTYKEYLIKIYYNLKQFYIQCIFKKFKERLLSLNIPPLTLLDFTLPFGDSYCTSCGSSYALLCFKHTVRGCHVLCDISLSIWGIIVVKACSNRSALLTIFVIVVHSNLYLDNTSQRVCSVVRSEMHDGLENGVGDVCEPRPIQQLRKYSLKMSHTLRAKCVVIYHTSRHTASISALFLSCGIKCTSDISM